MILFDPATARDVLDALRLLEGRLRGSDRGLSLGSLELRAIAERSVRVCGAQPVDGPGVRTDDHDVLALLTYRDVADRLQVSSATVKRLVAAGELPVLHIGSAARVRPVDLEAFIESQAGREAS
ncbi:MAG: helix-turn-helix domain-containing protein [Acidimicrobiia bacterium]